MMCEVKYQDSKRIRDIGFLNVRLWRRLKAEDNKMLQLSEINIQNSIKSLIHNLLLSRLQKQNKILGCS